MIKRVALLVALVAAVCLTATVLADEPTNRREWEQEKALRKVKSVIAMEAKGELPWDRIAWETDIEKAAARAKAENKPLLVYCFLKKNIGPAAAPC